MVCCSSVQLVIGTDFYAREAMVDGIHAKCLWLFAESCANETV